MFLAMHSGEIGVWSDGKNCDLFAHDVLAGQSEPAALTGETGKSM